MNNGTISGNNAGVVGGGVSLAYGSFRIVGGTVYGNTASPTTLRNTAGQSGAAVFAVREVDAQRGRFDARGNWVSMGNLPTTSNTINVVNGELR